MESWINKYRNKEGIGLSLEKYGELDSDETLHSVAATIRLLFILSLQNRSLNIADGVVLSRHVIPYCP
jgi:hypothetical protein